MYGKSNMETYITKCKIDSQWEFAVWLRKLKQGLCITLEGWDEEGDGREVQKGGNICMLLLLLLSHFSRGRLCDPMDCGLPGSSGQEILQARILEWIAIPFSRASFQPRDRIWVFCFAGRFFTI